MSLYDYLQMKLEDNLEPTYQDCQFLIKNLCLSLKKLHEINILHTDLKLDNILTNHYSDNIKDIKNYVETLNLGQKYETLLKCNTPDDLDEKNKNKRKMIKRKIKNKTNKQITLFVQDKMKEFKNKSVESEDDLNEIINSNDYFEENNNTKRQKTDNDKGIQNNGNDIVDNENNENNEDNEDNDIKKQIIRNDNILNDNFNIILSDLSNALTERDVEDDEEFQIRSYRSPENILGIKYSKRSESWAVGCVLWDILTTDCLFEPNLKQKNIDKDREQLALMEKYLGKISKDITMECPRTWELYEDSGKIIKNKKVKRVELDNLLREKRPDLLDEEINNLCRFLKKTWYYNYSSRLTPEELLKDEFLNI